MDGERGWSLGSITMASDWTQSVQCNEFQQSSKGFQDYESLWGGDHVEVLGEY